MKRPQKKALLSGNECVAFGAYESGLKVACAYPGTPSTEILECLAAFSEIDVQWSVNEKVAYEVALGAAVGGARSLYASKHVGLNVAMDPLMTSSYTGVNAGFVAVVCDDPGLHSSQNEQDTRWVGIYAKLPLLEPSSPGEAREFVKEAFKISERFDTPVLLRMTTRVSHSKEDVVPGERVEAPPREFKLDPTKYVMVPRNAYLRHIEVEKRLRRLQQFAERSRLNCVELGKKSLGFITSGVSYLYLKEQYPDASFLKLGFPYPFCDEKIRSFARRVKQLYVVEELDPFLEEHIRGLGVKFRSKDVSFRIGELRPEYAADIVRGARKAEKAADTRRPVMCPGCPHRFVFSVLRKLKIAVTGDIGCYTLGAAPPLAALHTCLCMGAGITFHEGFRRAQPERKIAGVVGDSTFVHSGIAGLINAAYNRMKGLVLILDNSTTAMTGAQNHPATGLTIRNEKTKRLVLEDVCKSCGADNVDVIDPHNLKQFEELVRKRLSEDSLSVIIARSPCKLLERSRRPSPVYIEDKCKKCYLCLNVNCPALSKREDGFIGVHGELCAGCYLCVQTCPFGALEENAR